MLDKKQTATLLGVTVNTLDGSLKSEIPLYKLSTPSDSKKARKIFTLDWSTTLRAFE